MAAVLEILTLAGIAIPAWLLTLGVRRWIAPLQWRIASLFLAISLAFTGSSVFTGDVPAPLDEIVRGYPWRGIVGEVEPKNPLTNDTSKLFLPWMDAAREELFAGRLPLWNRYVFSGYPLLANGESAPFSPFFLATIFVPLPNQITAMGALQIFVSLLFAFVFARDEKLSRAASIFVAVAFSLSVYQIVFLYYTAATVSALLPMAALALRLVLREASPRHVVFVALAVGTLLAAGHPETVLHVAIGCGLILLVDRIGAVRRRFGSVSVEPAEHEPASPGTDEEVGCRSHLTHPLRARNASMLFAAVACGLLVSAPTWVPVAEQVAHSQRMAEISAERAMTPPFDPGAAWALVTPDAYGNPARRGWNWIYNYSGVAASYVGFIVLALLPAALFGRGIGLHGRAYVLLAIGTFLLAMNWTFIGLLNHLPPLSITANDKLRFVTVFFASMAAAHALDRLRRDRLVLFAIGGAVLTWFLLQVVRAHYGPHFGAEVFIPLLAWLIVVGAALTPSLRRRRLVPAVAAVAVAIELFSLNVGFNPPVSRRYYAPELPIVEALRARQPDSAFRIAGHDWVFSPNTPTHYRLEDIRGSDPMAWAPYVEFLRLVADETTGADLLRVVRPDHPAVDFLNVRFLFTEPGVVPGERWERVYSGADGELFENRRTLPRFFIPGRVDPAPASPVLPDALQGIADFSEQSYATPLAAAHENGRASIWAQPFGPRRWRLTVEADREAIVASSQPAAPGWRVVVNGEPTELLTINGAFIGFAVPSGISRVVVSYAPASFTWSVVAAIGGALLLSGYAWKERDRGPRSA